MEWYDIAFRHDFGLIRFWQERTNAYIINFLLGQGLMKRIDQEIKTVGIMIDIYCRHHHGDDKRCRSCQELFVYATQRYLRCPFGKGKPVCAKCKIHCYQPEMREKIRAVMKFSGPKMIFSHPILAVRHLMAAHKEPPSSTRRRD